MNWTAWGAWSQWALRLGCSRDILILLWPSFCSPSRGALPQKCTKAVIWWNLPNMPDKISPERWQLSAQSSVPTTFHASWPAWSAYCHIFKPTPVSPWPTHIPAELWIDWYLVEAWQLGESLTLPPSECPTLDVDEGLTKGSRVKLDHRGGVPLLNFPTEPLRNQSTLLTPPPPLHETRSPWP